MKPLAVLQADMIEGARVLGWENEIGQLKPGFLADIVAVPANPLEDIRVVERVSFVMKGGVRHVHAREFLDGHQAAHDRPLPGEQPGATAMVTDSTVGMATGIAATVSTRANCRVGGSVPRETRRH